MRTVNILGTDYTIRGVRNKTEDVRLDLLDANAVCEPYTKEIILKDIPPDLRNVNDLGEYERKVLRHELVHAFLHESGLSSYESDELLVEWIAQKVNQMADVMINLDCLDLHPVSVGVSDNPKSEMTGGN